MFQTLSQVSRGDSTFVACTKRADIRIAALDNASEVRKEINNS